MQFTRTARALGVGAAYAIVGLMSAYAVVLVVGLTTLQSADDPIRDPFFSIMEILIVAVAPTIVLLMIAVHAWAIPASRTASLAALIFTSLMAGLTTSVHWVVLTVSHATLLAGQTWAPALFAFKWPSVAYALDILAWDVFFALGAGSAALVFREHKTIRRLLWLSALLAAAGLAGVALADMTIRNVGIVGYVLVFPAAAALIGRLLARTEPA